MGRLNSVTLAFTVAFFAVFSQVSFSEDHDEIKMFRQIPTAKQPAPTQLIQPFSEKPDNTTHHLVDNNADFNDGLEFKCVQVPGEKGWRPQSTRKKGHNQSFPPLGREPIPTRELCEQIVASSRNGVVCSNTGVAPFYKPTHFSGSTEYRKDFGFWGSSTSLENCLIATRYSSPEKVCYWGGEGWYVADIKGSKKGFGGNFKTVKDCVRSYGADPTQKRPQQSFTSLFDNRIEE